MLGNWELGCFDLPAGTNRTRSDSSANDYFPAFFIIKGLKEEFQNSWNRLTAPGTKARTRLGPPKVLLGVLMVLV